VTSYGIEVGTFCLLIYDLSSDVATSTERTASNGTVFSEYKVKVKFILEKAMKADRGNRGIAVHLL
jgi:hypothetical protein